MQQNELEKLTPFEQDLAPAALRDRRNVKALLAVVKQYLKSEGNVLKALFTDKIQRQNLKATFSRACNDKGHYSAKFKMALHQFIENHHEIKKHIETDESLYKIYLAFVNVANKNLYKYNEYFKDNEEKKSYSIDDMSYNQYKIDHVVRPILERLIKDYPSWMALENQLKQFKKFRRNHLKEYHDRKIIWYGEKDLALCFVTDTCIQAIFALITQLHWNNPSAEMPDGIQLKQHYLRLEGLVNEIAARNVRKQSA